MSIVCSLLSCLVDIIFKRLIVTIFSNNYASADGYSFTKAVTQTLEAVAQIMS